MLAGRTWPDLKSRWFDAEFQVDCFLESIRGRRFHGETFPVFWPNLGPNVYAAFHGAELDYGEVTSWIRHCIHDWPDVEKLKFSRDNVYFRKIEELTRVGLEKSAGRFLVGYTDLHGSLDCAADWRDPQRLCIDLIDCPGKVHELVRLANENFFAVYDHYDAVLKSHGQLSATWMGIPSRGKMHVSSCDFTAMTSTAVFCEFYLPSLLAEVGARQRQHFPPRRQGHAPPPRPHPGDPANRRDPMGAGRRRRPADPAMASRHPQDPGGGQGGGGRSASLTNSSR